MNRRVALIDDHAIVRAGLKALVEDVPDYKVVAEGGMAMMLSVS